MKKKLFSILPLIALGSCATKVDANNEIVEAVEVSTEDTKYLVKVSTKLAVTMENYDEDFQSLVLLGYLGMLMQRFQLVHFFVYQ